MSKRRPIYLEDRFQGPVKPRLLLVDDDELMRRSTQRFLTRAGFDVSTAASGHRALEMLEEGLRVDVFVIDLEMPEMNGIELMRRLDVIAHDIPRGLWSASQDLSDLTEEDLSFAWFVKNKQSPIGELVQSACQAIYGARTAVDDEGTQGKKMGRHRRTSSGYLVRKDREDTDTEPRDSELTPGSSSR